MGLVDRGRMPAPLTKLFNMGRSYSMWVYQWGLACCAIEMGAAFGSPRYDVMRLGVIPLPASPRQADLVVVSGTVTDKMAPAVKRLYEQMPEPKYVISMGSCANCGGPYWDSYSVTKGVDQIIPVDVYVPGCPPRPEALLEGIVLLQQRIKNEDMAAKWRNEEYTSLQTTAAASGPTPNPSRSWSEVARLSDATDTTAGSDTEVPALPGDGLREGIVDHLRSDLGEHVLAVHLVPQDDLWVRVAPEAWAVAAAALKAQGFHYFCFLSAIDWLPSPYGKGEDDPSAEPEEPAADAGEINQGVAGGETRFQVFGRLTDIERHVSVTLKADVPDSMSMPTWIPSFAGANWHERETHEMFGIGFDGHPDLRNLYLPGAFEGFPLRKDFPLLSRMVKPWPGIVDVEPMPVSDGEDGDSDD